MRLVCGQVGRSSSEAAAIHAEGFGEVVPFFEYQESYRGLGIKVYAIGFNWA